VTPGSTTEEIGGIEEIGCEEIVKIGKAVGAEIATERKTESEVEVEGDIALDPSLRKEKRLTKVNLNHMTSLIQSLDHDHMKKM
jgi:hypothetical protein